MRIVALIVVLISVLVGDHVNPAPAGYDPQVVNITRSPNVNDAFAGWSTDRQTLFFVRQDYLDNSTSLTTTYESDLAGNLSVIHEAESIYEANWSPDLQYLAFFTSGGTLMISNRAGETVLEQKFDGISHPLVWSADGTQFLVMHAGGTDIVALDGSVVQHVTDTTVRASYPVLAWSPDGSQLALVVENHIWVTAVDDAADFPQANSMPVVPGWSPDGTRLVFAVREEDDFYGRATLFTVNADGSDRTPLTSASAHNDFCPRWSPDGEKIAFLRGNSLYEGGTLFVLDLATGELSWLDRPGGRTANCPHWSTDSQWLGFNASYFMTGLPTPSDVFIAPLTAFKTDIATAVPGYRVSFLSQDDRVNVYALPGNYASVIDQLQAGDYVTVTGGEQVSEDGMLWTPIEYEDGNQGWVASEFLAGTLDPVLFCEDPRILTVLETLQEAVRTQDGALLASIISPRGLYIGYREGDTLFFTPDEIRNFFNDSEPRNWGSGYGSEDRFAAPAGAVNDDLQSDLLPDDITIACNDNQFYITEWTRLYALNIPGHDVTGSFYSVMRPGPPENDLDWGAWGLAFEYRGGRPVLLGLASYQWSP